MVELGEEGSLHKISKKKFNRNESVVKAVTTALPADKWKLVGLVLELKVWAHHNLRIFCYKKGK